jgi:hypothetical protein
MRERGGMERLALLAFVILLAAADGGRVVAAVASREELGPKEAAIDDAICADHARAGRWNAAWALTFSIAAVTTAGLATFAPSDWFSSDARAGLYVTAAKATVATAAKLVDPLRLDVGRLCDEGHEASVKTRHALLGEAARKERRALIPNVLGGVVLNSVSLIYLGFVRGDWDNAWISFAVGSAVSVVSTLTAPTQAWLLKRRLDESHQIAAVPFVGVGTAGMALVTRW